MGRTKLLHKVAGQTVFEISLGNHLASSLPAICGVVAGWLTGFREIIDEYRSGRVSFVALDEPCEMSCSLKAGWRWLVENADPDAIMISLADQPLVTAATIDLLIDCYLASDMPICVPIYDGRQGHPVIVSTSLGEEIMGLKGDRGAKEILLARRGETEEVPVDSDEVILDLDRPEDMDILRSRLMAHE
jgi:molybdenum cofactor cytidylyltransferase